MVGRESQLRGTGLLDDGGAQRTTEWSHTKWALTTVGILVALVAVSAQDLSHLVDGWLGYADAYMRMARVEALFEAPLSWYDGRVMRSNAPVGEALHWTRPLDLILAAPALLLRPFLGRDAIVLAAIVVPPLILVGTCATAAWMVRPLLRDLDPPMVALFVFGQPLVVGYGLPGRADHHLLIVLLAMALFGAVVRIFLDHEEGAARVAGIATGIGLWVSPETLLPYGLATIALGLPWLAGAADGWARRNERLHAFAAGTVLFALVLERPPGDWLALELDRLSVIHLILTSGLVTFWFLVGRAKPSTRFSRFGVAVGSASALAVLLVALRPTFLLGPFGDVDPRLAETWLQHVQELQPLPWTPGGGLAYFGAPATALLLLPVILTRMPDRRGAVAFLGAALALTGVMGIREVRWLIYAEVVAAALLAVSVSELRHTLPDTPPNKLLKAAAVVLAATLWVIGGGVTDAFLGSERPGAAAADGDACTARDAVGELRQAELEGSRTVAAHVDLGPPIVFTTPHAVLAAPYHRNSGVMVVHDALNSADTVEARQLLASREVDLLLLCEGFDEPFFRREIDGDQTLYGRILDDEQPSWMTRVRPPAEGSGVRLYNVH